MEKMILEYCFGAIFCVFGALIVGLLCGYLIGSKWYKGGNKYYRKSNTQDKVYFINVEDLRKDKCQKKN